MSEALQQALQAVADARRELAGAKSIALMQEDALKGDRKSGELEQLQEISERLSDIQDRVTSADTKRATLSSELNRKERKLINEILALLSETLDDPSFEKAKQAILTKYGTPNGDTK